MNSPHPSPRLGEGVPEGRAFAEATAPQAGEGVRVYELYAGPKGRMRITECGAVVLVLVLVLVPRLSTCAEADGNVARTSPHPSPPPGERAPEGRRARVRGTLPTKVWSLGGLFA